MSMNMSFGAALIIFAFVLPSAQAIDSSPIQKVLQMLSDLETKIVTEGTNAQKVYDEFSQFCQDRSTNLGFEVKTGKSEVNALDADIAKAIADSQSLNAKIEELASAIGTNEADLKAATEIRDKEKAAFQADENELTDVIGTLQRAITIIEKEMSKGGASMMQLKSANSVAEAFQVIVQATSLNTADASKLTALVQNSAQDGDEELAAPAAVLYKSSSSGIVSTLQDLFEKAENQLEEARKSEAKSAQAFARLAQSLKDEIGFGQKDMDRAKKNLGAVSEAKATADGDLAVTSKDLAEDISTLATLHQECMKGAEDFEAETKSRGEELKALATAKKVIDEATSGAADQSYSFVQVSSSQRLQLSSGSDLANFEAVRFVRDLARKHNSRALAQLASRMAQVMGSSGHSSNPFEKVRSLISNMIDSLERQAEEDTTEHSFCEKELAETATKKEDRTSTVERLSTDIDSKTAKSAKLKRQVAELERQLAALARTQAEAGKIRAEEKAAFDSNSAEMEKGIKGVQLALQVLNEYYAKTGKSHQSAEGPSSDIIGLLEVVESDFSKSLAEMTADEQSAVSDYIGLGKANEIERAAKLQDVAYKTKESKSLDKSKAEAENDRSTVQQELDAVNDYDRGIKARCIAKAEAYAERARRRDEEITGLKEALSILEGEAVLLQQGSKHKLRGTHS